MIRVSKGGKHRESELPKPPRETPAVFQARTPIHCPHCGAPSALRPRKPRQTASDPGKAVYYKCQECDLDGDGGTAFKVRVIEPSPELRRLGLEEAPGPG